MKIQEELAWAYFVAVTIIDTDISKRSTNGSN